MQIVNMNEWRDHPQLRGRLHPDHPDDLQVIVHDGGPRLTQHSPELVWVTVTGYKDNIFTGRTLNRPEQLSSVLEGSVIKFLIPEGVEHALMVTDKYLTERPNWTVGPCSKCGLPELFDAPSDIMRIVFPDAPPDAVMEMFTAFCGLCGGVQVIQHRGTPIDPGSPEPPNRKWWQFWRRHHV